MNKSDLGDRISEARKSKGYTQKALAIKTKLSEGYIREIEAGLKKPSLDTFIKIVEGLDVSADYILRGELTSGKVYVYEGILAKIDGLNPKHRKCIDDIIDAYIKNI